MTKRFLLTIALSLAFALSGCANPSSSSSTQESQPSSSSSISSASSQSESTQSSEESSYSISSDESSESKSSSEESSSPVLSSDESSSSVSSDTASSSSIESSSSSAVIDEHWDVDMSKVGQEFLVTLSEQILASGNVANYSACLNIGAQAAAYPTVNSSTFIPFYHDHTDANKTTKNGCNREHTWPKSRAGDWFENDPVMVRPTLSSDNTSRGNDYYGLGGTGEWDPASLGYEGARGESARIILYCATAYYAMGVKLTNNPSDSNSMGTLRTLLDWNRTYPPSDFEKLVNERYDSFGYRRNPFVDHPEYADQIWDDDGIRVGGEDDWLDPINDASSLNGRSLSIVTEAADSAGSYFAMTGECKGSLYWYISGAVVRYEDGKIAKASTLTKFTFEQTGTNKYRIQKQSGEYLYGYKAIDSSAGKTYTSIGFGNDASAIQAQQSGKTIDAISNEWTFTGLSGGGFSVSASGVYLEYYNGSFCGYRQSAKPIRLYA